MLPPFSHHTVHLRPWHAVLAAVACLAGPAHAQQPDPQPALAQVPLEELMGMKMVQAASRFEQLALEAPAAVSVLTSDDIRAHGWRTLAEALASLPGLYVTDDRNYTYLGARGFLRPGDYNSRFLLTVDGVRVNDALYDQAMLGNDGLVDIDLVRRIEFIPGAGSAMYGSNALLGVINVITRDGDALPGARVALRAGSAGERRLRASYGWHDQRGADLLLAASALTRDGETLYYPEFDDAGGDGVARGRDGEGARQFMLKARAGGFTFSANHVHRTKQLPTASYGTLFGAPSNTTDARTTAQLGYGRELAPGVALALQGQWGSTDYLGHYYYADAEGLARPNVDGAHARWYGAGAHLAITRLAGHKILFGAEAGRDARRDQFNFDTAPYLSLLDDRRSADRRGVFVEDELRLGRHVLVNASLRHDRHSTGARSNSPRVALLYRVPDGATFKLIYGRAYRVPNAYEMYYQVAGDGGQLPNPALAPERISTAEAVLERAFGGASHARLSLFAYRMRDLIAQEADAASGLLIYRNLERAAARGLEASFEHLFDNNARVRASYTWQRATDGAGRPLPDSPRHLGKVNAVLPLPALRARLGAELQCMSGRLTARAGAGGAVGGYCVSNMNLSSTRLVAGAELAAGVFNLADRRYADPAGPAFVQEALQRQGRSAFVRLAFGF